MKVCVAAALIAAAVTVERPVPAPALRAIAQRPTVIDAFENVGGWSAQPSDGVSLRISSDAGVRGRAMRLDYDFHGGGGYAVARRKVNVRVPANYEFSFHIRGEGTPNTLELKFVDPSGDNVWWSNQPNFELPREWREVVRKKRHITFAWGPKGGGDLAQVAAIEIAITAGTGGRGTVWIDELTLRPREPDRPYTLTPRVVASSEQATFEAVRALDGDSATAWRPAPAAPATPGASATPHTLTIDFQRDREFGGLVLDWAPSLAATHYAVHLSRDGRQWEMKYRVDGGNGGRDYLFLPESDARYVRVLIDSAAAEGPALREVTVQPLEWSATKNDFFLAVARDAPPGSYPKYLNGVQSYWTVIGVDGDAREAMINEEGMIETGKGRFSIEPFLSVDGRLVTWRDATVRQSLAADDQPHPSVAWEAGSVALTVEPVVAAGGRDSSAVFARYRVHNRAAGRRAITLYLAVRPFQVNPAWQFLNTVGGAATVREIAFADRVVRVNGEEALVSFNAADGFGAVTFDQGNIVDFLRRGALPEGHMVRDHFGHASAALAYTFEVDSGLSAAVEVAIPLHAAAVPALLRAREAGALPYEARRRESARLWRAMLDQVTVELPPSAARVANSIRANLAYILVNRDGPALQPGSRSYERSWIRDGALTSTALLRLGRADAVREFIEWYAPFQYPNGKVPCCVDHRGADPVPENDSHGEFIYLIAEYWRHTGDRALVERLWPNVARAVTYMDSLRRSRMTSEYERPQTRVFYGLLPQSISHEGYSAKPMHSYWDQFFALRGFKDAVELGRLLGRPETDSFAAMRDEFARHLYMSLELAMANHKIDYLPGAAELGDFDATSTTIALSPVGELRRLPQPALDRTFERYWQEFVARRDGAKEWDAYTPYEWRVVGTMVRLGQKERAHALADWFFTHQRPEPWRHWAEVVWREPATPKFIGDMPHTWVGSDYIRSMLDMLAYEREADSSLVVGAGIPEAWINERPGVTVRRLSTHYGPLGFTVRRENEGVRFSMQSGLRIPPGGIVVHSPFTEPPRQMLVNGVPVTGATATSVVVRSLPVEVVFRR